MSVAPASGGNDDPVPAEVFKKASDSPNTWRDRLYCIYLAFRLGRVPQAMKNQVVYIDRQACNEAGVIISKQMSCEELNKIAKRDGAVRIVHISDTHERHEALTIPNCDVLVHTGDILFAGRKQSLQLQINKLRKFDMWMGKSPSRHRVVVAGNHDSVVERLERGDGSQVKEVFAHSLLLHNKSISIMGLQFGGTPYSEGLSRNRAYQGSEIRDSALLNLRDTDVDVLLSHSDDIQPAHINIKPKLWLWGHHHNRRGFSMLDGGVLSLCSSVMDRHYRPSHPPTVVDL